jgi:tRNA 2-selenouridine synthase SelU
MKLYRKNERGRYEEIGDEWRGFPANGWWVVADGRQNLVVPIDSPRPLEKLRFQQYRNELVDRLEQQQTARSLTQFVEDVLDLLEELVSEDMSR